MELKVPIILQKSIESIDCGVKGLQMIFNFYGIPKADNFFDNLKLYPGIGTYMPQLGEFMIENGFDAEIVTVNPYLFTLSHGKMSQDELLNYLKGVEQTLQNERFREPLKYFIKFMEKGGKLTIKVPSKEIIENEIKNNRPMGALVTSSFLLYDKSIFNFHFNIITGIDDKFIYVNDPVPDYRGGRHKFLINDYMYALYASAYGDIDNASLLLLKKKQQKN